MSNLENEKQEIRKRAVSLRYAANADAPTVIAKGYGSVAEGIIAMAKKHDIYVHESPELVDLLMQVDLDEQIPPILYGVVAELLAWLYTLEGKHIANSPSETNSAESVNLT